MLILYRKHAICLKDYRIRSFLSIQYVHGDLCKLFVKDSNTDHQDRYLNLFLLNAYINLDPGQMVSNINNFQNQGSQQRH